jgi:hypothetical protein
MTDPTQPPPPPSYDPSVPPPPPAGYGYGQASAGAAPGYAPQTFGAPPALVRAVPGSVKAVSIIQWVVAGLLILGGLVALAGLALLGTAFGSGGAGAAIGFVVAVVLWAFAAAYVVLGRLLRKGSRGARIASVVLAGIGVLYALGSMRNGILSPLLSLVLNGAIIYLLMFEAQAKAFFGDT